jgi:hypothetical protein
MAAIPTDIPRHKTAIRRADPPAWGQVAFTNPHQLWTCFRQVDECRLPP